MQNSEKILEALKKADAAGNEADARKLAAMYKKALEIESRPEINNLAEGTRKVAQGLTFGFGEEIEAKLKTGGPGIIQLPPELLSLKKENMKMLNKKITGKLNEQELARYNENQSKLTAYNDEIKKQYNTKYIAERDRLRLQDAEFTRQNPILAPVLEIAGGITSPIALTRALGKQAFTQATKKLPSFLKGTTGQGAGYGSAYGAGTADELSDVPQDVLFGAGLGGVGSKLISGAGKFIAPRLKQGAEALFKRGVQLTPGQASGGGLLNTLEQKLGAIVPNIKTRRYEALKDWNKTTADDILAPIKKKLPKGDLEIQDIGVHTNNAVNEVYDNTLSKLVIKKTKDFNNIFKDFLNQEKSVLDVKSFNFLKKEINGLKRQIGKNGRTGQSVKDVKDYLLRRTRAYKNSTNIDESSAFQSVDELNNIFRSALRKQNPKYADDLLNIDKAFGNIAKLEIALGAGNRAGAFTIAQLNTANVQGTFGKGSKRITKATNRGFLGTKANQAKEFLSDTVADSGTAGNVALMTLLSGGAGYGLHSGDAPALLTGGALVPAIAWGLYTKPGRRFVTNYLRSGKPRDKLREALEKFAPTAGLLSSQQFNQEQ